MARHDPQKSTREVAIVRSHFFLFKFFLWELAGEGVFWLSTKYMKEQITLSAVVFSLSGNFFSPEWKETVPRQTEHDIRSTLSSIPLTK